MANTGMDALEKLEVWKRGCRLAVDLYNALEQCRDYGLKDQITRSAISVPSNIAEGFERDSSREFSRFLKIAKGSCGELRTQLYCRGNGISGAGYGFSHDSRSFGDFPYVARTHQA